MEINVKTSDLRMYTEVAVKDENTIVNTGLLNTAEAIDLLEQFVDAASQIADATMDSSKTERLLDIVLDTINEERRKYEEKQ